MIQEIITYAIVSFAFGYAIRGSLKLFKKNSASACSTGACGCGSKSGLINEIKKGKKPYILTHKVV